MRQVETAKSKPESVESDGGSDIVRNRNLDENSALLSDLEKLFDDEKDLVRELIKGLREIRYGSIVLTLHEGQVVEINKSIRIRKGRVRRNTQSLTDA